MTEPLDIDHLRGWIGREEIGQDIVSADLARRFHATFDLPGDPPDAGEVAPRLIHFCLAQPALPAPLLGHDGHPARGGVLPPVPLPRRMWAGSAIRFAGDLRVGDAVRRRSTVVDVTAKAGRTGALCFVTVDHVVAVDGAARIEDRQTIVYRGLDAAAPAPAPDPVREPAAAEAVVVVPDTTLLFRYSALTFNGHRIHYDRSYATQVEGYPGLVVHGPLQATLLLQLATRARAGVPPDRFVFRALSPAFDGVPLSLHTGPVAEDMMPLWTARPDGVAAMTAQAQW